MKNLKKYGEQKAVAIGRIKEIKANNMAINLVVNWGKYNAETGLTEDKEEKLVIFRNGGNTAERFENLNIEVGTVMIFLLRLSNNPDEAHIVNGFILHNNKFELTIPAKDDKKEYKFSVIYGKVCKVKTSDDKNLLYITCPCFIKDRGIEFVSIKVGNADFNNNLKDRAEKCIFKGNEYAFITSEIKCETTDIPKKDKDGKPLFDKDGKPIFVNYYSCFLNGFESIR